MFKLSESKGSMTSVGQTVTSLLSIKEMDPAWVKCPSLPLMGLSYSVHVETYVKNTVAVVRAVDLVSF